MEKFNEAIKTIDTCIDVIEQYIHNKSLIWGFSIEEPKKIYNNAIELKKEIIKKIRN